LSSFLMAFVHWISAEDQWRTETVEFGAHGYVEYHPGNTNLILSIPHGGEWKPPYMKSRSRCMYDEEDDDEEISNTRVTVGTDRFTMEIGKEFIREYMDLTGKQPYIVVTNLQRSKLDANRPISVGVCPDEPLSECAYKDYHNYLKRAAKEIGGAGLLIDLHGQNHKQNCLELGYLLLKSDLNKERYSARSTSIDSLIRRTGLSVEEMVFGNSSLGALFEQNGYKAVPSPRQKKPGSQKYYCGGYITQIHGSSHAGEIDSIQIEVPGEIRTVNEFNRVQFARTMARVINIFHTKFYSNLTENK